MPGRSSKDIKSVNPFPEVKWQGLSRRVTSACRDFFKRWDSDEYRYEIRDGATGIISINIFMRGNGGLVGWTNPKVTAVEPGSHDWVRELGLGTESSE